MNGEQSASAISGSVDTNSLDMLKKRYLAIRSPKMKRVLKIQSEVMMIVREFLRREGYLEIQPPIVGPVTDPGIRGAEQATISWYNGASYKIMSSMILYKQMVIAALEKVYAFSPNVRLEPVEARRTGRHLSEFWQVDIERAFATCEDAMDLAERLLVYAIDQTKRRCGKELDELGNRLEVPSIPFERITHKEAVEKARALGLKVDNDSEIPWDAEKALSASYNQPFWITDYPTPSRGFYYLEDPERPGLLRSMDLLYPDGFGEAISGGEREFRYDRVVKRIRDGGENPVQYKWYLEMLKYGVPPSAGFGIGVERLTRFLCGLSKIWDATPFPKVPGVVSL
ncbi:MAG: asparagine synthetase A [Candidatus Bathyarchaeia archaeon]